MMALRTMYLITVKLWPVCIDYLTSDYIRFSLIPDVIPRMSKIFHYQYYL